MAVRSFCASYLFEAIISIDHETDGISKFICNFRSKRTMYLARLNEINLWNGTFIESVAAL